MSNSVIETIIELPRSYPSVIGLGAFLKATVTIIKDKTAYISKTLGNLESIDIINEYENLIARLIAETHASPVLAAHDLHPDFYSSRLALDKYKRTLAVQHHHAHAAAVAIDAGHDAPFLCLALDGFGLGPNNEAWGGELLLCKNATYRRLGYLHHLAQPGGDIAAREPWRMGAAALHALGRGEEITKRWNDQPCAGILKQILDKNINSPLTSSCGRLFDAACGLLGICPVADFEGQAPMALESMVVTPYVMDGGWSIKNGVLDVLPLLAALNDCDAQDGANLFHGTLAAALVDWAIWAAEAVTLQHVGISGGCFFNKVISSLVTEGLKTQGLTVLRHNRVSTGDPGISLGQAWVATQSILTEHE